MGNPLACFLYNFDRPYEKIQQLLWALTLNSQKWVSKKLTAESHARMLLWLSDKNVVIQNSHLRAQHGAWSALNLQHQTMCAGRLCALASKQLPSFLCKSLGAEIFFRQISSQSSYEMTEVSAKCLKKCQDTTHHCQSGAWKKTFKLFSHLSSLLRFLIAMMQSRSPSVLAIVNYSCNQSLNPPKSNVKHARVSACTNDGG